MNASSSSKNMDNLEHLLKCSNKLCDIFAVSEIRITKKFLKDYQYKFTKLFT